jgi:hypothetical protein
MKENREEVMKVSAELINRMIISRELRGLFCIQQLSNYLNRVKIKSKIAFISFCLFFSKIQK